MMKKLMALCVAGGVLSAPSFAGPAAVGALADVKVSGLNFEAKPAGNAFSDLARLSGTSIVVNDCPISTAKISAIGVSGPLPAVLDKLTSMLGCSWSERDGVVMVNAKLPEAPTPAPVKSLHKDDAVVKLAEPVAAAPVEAPVPSPEVWSIVSGKSLRETIHAWASTAGWKVDWAANDDYLLMASAEFQSTFDGAVESLLNAVNVQGHLFHARAYSVNKVLRITQ